MCISNFKCARYNIAYSSYVGSYLLAEYLVNGFLNNFYGRFCLMKDYLKTRKGAFRHAFVGVVIFFREGKHAQLMLLLMVLTIIFSILFPLSSLEWITIIICIGLVLGLEALNSAMEYLVDLNSPNRHLLAKKTKDVAAAAVLLASICSASVALIIFVPKILMAWRQGGI